MTTAMKDKRSLRTNKRVCAGPRGSQDRGLGRPREGGKRFSHGDLTPLWELSDSGWSWKITHRHQDLEMWVLILSCLTLLCLLVEFRSSFFADR